MPSLQTSPPQHTELVSDDIAPRRPLCHQACPAPQGAVRLMDGWLLGCPVPSGQPGHGAEGSHGCPRPGLPDRCRGPPSCRDPWDGQPCQWGCVSRSHEEPREGDVPPGPENRRVSRSSHAKLRIEPSCISHMAGNQKQTRLPHTSTLARGLAAPNTLNLFPITMSALKPEERETRCGGTG